MCRGKSGLHEARVAGNARPGQPEGQCHREYTADGWPKVLGFSQGISDYGPEDEAREAVVSLQPGDLAVHHGETIHRDCDYDRYDYEMNNIELQRLHRMKQTRITDYFKNQ